MLEGIYNEIKKYKRVAVAFSGGVDSTFLLKMCILNTHKKELKRNDSHEDISKLCLL